MKRGTNALSISAQVVLWLPPRIDTGKETLRIQFKHWSPVVTRHYNLLETGGGLGIVDTLLSKKPLEL